MNRTGQQFPGPLADTGKLFLPVKNASFFILKDASQRGEDEVRGAKVSPSFLREKVTGPSSPFLLTPGKVCRWKEKCRWPFFARTKPGVVNKFC